MYNILHGRVTLPIDDCFETPANPYIRGNRFKLRHQLSHWARRKFTYPVRFVELWNKVLPEDFDSASKEIFKRRLDGVGTPCLLPNPPRTFIKFVINLSFFPFVQMPVRGYVARRCLFLDHARF